jgi:EmrB/QacA subfamily drug resistance transporter
MSSSVSPEPVAAAVKERPAQQGDAPHWALLPIILTGVFMSVLDAFIVIVAIPSIQSDLHASSAAIQFVIAGFALAYGACLITAGRLGDLYGRRRLFVYGLILFTLASAACGLAPNVPALLAARVFQGIAAGLLSPQALAILSTVFTGEAKGRAFSAYGLTMGLAGAFGQLIGGLLIEADFLGTSWRACFLINVPFGLAAVLLAPRFVPESRGSGRARLDLGGMLLITMAVVAVVLPLIEGRQQGWPLWTIACLAAAGPLVAIFGLHQARRGRRDGAPLVDVKLFRERAFTVGLIAQLVFWMGQASFFLVFVLYVQQGRGMGARDAGLIIVPQSLGYLITSMNAHRFARLLGRQVIAVGGLLRIVGLIGLAVTVTSIGVGGHVLLLAPALIIDGAGMGMALAPLASTVLARVSPRQAGAGSGVLVTALHVGNAVGVAIIGILFYDALGAAPRQADYAHALTLSLLYLAAVLFVLTVIVQLLPRTVRRN